MYSSDGKKQFIVGIASSISRENRTGLACEPNSTALYMLVYPHLDWIRSLIGDERCIANAFQLEPEKLWAHLQAVALSILSIALTTYLILTDLKKPRPTI